jgi:integrase
MREAELIALEWSSVDLKAGSVHVCRSASRVPAGPEGHRYLENEFKTTKTGEARGVPLDPQTLAWLKEHRKAVAAAKLALRPSRWTDKDGDLVFPALSVFAGTGAGRAWRADTLRRVFHRYAAKVGLGYLRFHDLRHTYASLLVAQGVDIAYVSRQLGHANITTTLNTYTHLFDHARNAETVKQRLEEQFGGILSAAGGDADPHGTLALLNPANES